LAVRSAPSGAEEYQSAVAQAANAVITSAKIIAGRRKNSDERGICY